MADRYDAIVVGLGAAGALAAQVLCEAGLRVLGLEKGPGRPAGGSAGEHDEIRHFIRGELLPRMRTDPLTWRPRRGTRARLLPWATEVYPLADPFHLPPSIGVGGGSVHWTGAWWRRRASEFRMRTEIVRRFGAAALPPGTDVRDWPVSYADLEPYYDRVEWELGVSGTAGNIGGVRQAGGNPFEPWRRRGYPLPPLRRGPADAVFVSACERLGYHPFPQPAAILSRPYQGRPACTYCGFCHGYPCHVGAKASTGDLCLPRALATGNLELRTGVRVTGVLHDATGTTGAIAATGARTARRARGVTYVDAEGRRGAGFADVVLLACYTLENTRLLLLSGIHGDGQVGRWFQTHNYGDVTGLLPVPVNGFMGAQAAASVIDDFGAEAVPDNGSGVLWGSPVFSVPGDFQPLEAVHMRPSTVPRWGAALKTWLKESFSRLYGLCSQTANLPSTGAYCDLDPRARDPLGLPALRITHGWTGYDRRAAALMMGIKRRIADEMGMTERWEAPLAPGYHISNHDAGTYRMGEDPATSVAGRYGQCHACRGLYMLGGGLFPTLGGYNPTATILALTWRTAEHIAGRRVAPIPAAAGAEAGR
jgi:gluconate 2-dehydrogenase alpha chain